MGERRGVYRFLVGKPEGKRVMFRVELGGGGNIKKKRCDGVF
jgi:hypothetical protein